MTAAARRSIPFAAALAFPLVLGCANTTYSLPPGDEGTTVTRDDGEYDPPSDAVDDAAYAAHRGRSDAPDVRVWLAGGNDVYRWGDRVRVHFRVRDDAYVTIVRVDTDGELRVLYPSGPHATRRVSGGRRYRVPGHVGDETFAIDDPTGVGYVFAISSYEPFDYSALAGRGGWDYHAVGRRVRGDPYVAVRRLADEIAYDDRTGYATAYAEYYVGRRVEYPRYACYDCHSAGSYPVYDPYGRHGHRVIVYDDPYYYPYRYYPGTRVVYAPRSRYEFKRPAGRGAAGADAPSTVVEHRRRAEDADLRRPGSPAGDPNTSGRRPSDGGSGAGATRPGDEVPANGGGRRGRDDASASAPAAPPRPGLGTPRRDPAPGQGGTGSPAPAPGGGGDDDEHPGREHGRGPRRDPPGHSGGDGGGHGNGDGGVGDGWGSGSGPGNGVGRRDDRRGEPRSEPPASVGRAEPQRAEPQRAEPKLERRDDRRSEPKPEAPREGDGRSAEGKGTVTRRRVP